MSQNSLHTFLAAIHNKNDVASAYSVSPLLPDFLIWCSRSRHPTICNRYVSERPSDKLAVSPINTTRSWRLPASGRRTEGFLRLFEELQEIWAGHHGRMEISKDLIELTFQDVLPVYSVAHQSGITARQIVASKTDPTLKKDIIQPNKTEWASSIFFAPKETVRFNFVSMIVPYTL